MAGPDQRRSSRARTTQSQSQLSSTSSSSSGRAERNTRSFNKTGSPQKSTPSASLSSEPPDESIAAPDDALLTRRRTRGQADERDKPSSKPDDVEMVNVEDDIQEDDEAVRCICGYDEYPGPPPFDDDARQGPRDTIDIEPIFMTDVTDDLAGFFVQCDICKVWQHGACVGIMTEESSPDEYFCEECRKDLHKIYTAKNGQRYSHYLPLKRLSRTTSRATSLVKDGTRSPKERDSKNGRTASVSQTSKRRSTLNSREAGYDEAEALRRAIEASKEEALHDHLDSTTRRVKRGRSDSEEKQENAKRQRTSSRSLSPPADKTLDDSDDGAATARNGTSKSRSRNAAARNQRAEKLAEREERERQRAEAASKRKGRAERRRADDSDPSEEMPLAARAAAIRTGQANPIVEIQLPGLDPPASLQPTPDTPPANSAAASNSNKKTSRSHKKKGRNQYTKDREGQDEESPARSQSRDIQRDENGTGGTSKLAGPENSRPYARAKGGMNSKVTMSDMKRRATAILDFISRTQLELAGEALPGLSQQSPRPSDDGAKDGNRTPGLNGDSSDKKPPDSGDGMSLEQDGEADPRKDFKELSCMEMMDSLTTRLVKWQQEYSA